ncbi:MAG: helix-turn-helix domain-containing protein [Nocardioidaceae bacterium]
MSTGKRGLFGIRSPGGAVQVSSRMLPWYPRAPAARHPASRADRLEVLRLVAEGLSDAEIADRLVLRPHTVHRQAGGLRRARARLGCR